MSEAEKDAGDRAKKQPGLSSGKKGYAAQLINAAVWIFIVTGFSMLLQFSMFSDCPYVCNLIFEPILIPRIIST
jgi:hypothetical protein